MNCFYKYVIRIHLNPRLGTQMQPVVSLKVILALQQSLLYTQLAKYLLNWHLTQCALQVISLTSNAKAVCNWTSWEVLDKGRMKKQKGIKRKEDKVPNLKANHLNSWSNGFESTHSLNGLNVACCCKSARSWWGLTSSWVALSLILSLCLYQRGIFRSKFKDGQN